jgi:RNA polymerase sigma factor for flagellar operon FliA
MRDASEYESIQQGTSDENRLAQLRLVRKVAVHLKARVPDFVEVDDLVQYGIIGLLEAEKAFDASKGIPFDAFVRQRIRGAMIDEIRRMSDIPRSAVANLKAHGEASKRLAATLGREPTQAEIAAELGLSDEAFQNERTHAHRFQTLAYDDVEQEVDGVTAAPELDPSVLVADQEGVDALQEAIGALPERDQLILQLYYVEELNLKEVGAVIGVSESRVSQLITASASKLRRLIAC